MAVSTNDVEQGAPQGINQAQYKWEVRRSKYLDEAVEPWLQHRSWLEVLHKFMDPAAKGFSVDLHRRMEHFDIKVVQITISGELSPVIDCRTPEDFHNAVKEDRNQRSTLVFAKDLSRAMIDALGTRYELEPEFFASHLAGTELYTMGRRDPVASQNPARIPNLLPNYIRKAPFYTAEFRRPGRIEGGADRAFELRGSVTNLTRGIHILKNDLPDVFVLEKISIYKKDGSNIGIILTDQLLSEDLPPSYIPSPVTLLTEEIPTPGSDSRIHQLSSRHELISHLQRLPPSSTLTLFTSPHSPLLLSPVLKIVERASAQFLEHVRYIMIRVLNRHCDDQFPDSIAFFLLISRSLHKHIYEQQRLLRNALLLTALIGGEGLVEQKQDFGFLMDNMDAALKALEEDVRFLVAAASIREGKVVGWVSKFAALFLPVSLLATILAISDPGYTRWAILGGLSLPFVLISVYFMFFWKPAHLNSLSFD